MASIPTITPTQEYFIVTQDKTVQHNTNLVYWSRPLDWSKILVGPVRENTWSDISSFRRPTAILGGQTCTSVMKDITDTVNDVCMVRQCMGYNYVCVVFYCLYGTLLRHPCYSVSRTNQSSSSLRCL